MATLNELRDSALKVIQVIRKSEVDSNIAQRELGSILHTVDSNLKAYFPGKKVSERKARYVSWYTKTLKIDKFLVNNALGRHALGDVMGVRFANARNTAQVKELVPSANKKVQGKLESKASRKAETKKVWDTAKSNSKSTNPSGKELHKARVNLNLAGSRNTPRGTTFASVLTLASKMTSESIGSISEDQYAEWQSIIMMVETGFVNQEIEKEEEVA